MTKVSKGGWDSRFWLSRGEARRGEAGAQQRGRWGGAGGPGESRCPYQGNAGKVTAEQQVGMRFPEMPGRLEGRARRASLIKEEPGASHSSQAGDSHSHCRVGRGREQRFPGPSEQEGRVLDRPVPPGARGRSGDWEPCPSLEPRALLAGSPGRLRALTMWRGLPAGPEPTCSMI